MIPMSVDETVVLLAPEVEFVPEDAVHQHVVDQIYSGLRTHFAGRDDVAVHARLAWFPDRGETHVRLDPDVMVVLGRPQAPRRSYRQWDEEGVPPSVMIEVCSQEDTDAGYHRRLGRAAQYGVPEAVLVNPFGVGGAQVFHLIADPDAAHGWRTVALSASPDVRVMIGTLGIWFSGGAALVVGDEHGPWPDITEALLLARGQQARADSEQARADRLAARLRDLGIDPEEPGEV